MTSCHERAQGHTESKVGELMPSQGYGLRRDEGTTHQTPSELMQALITEGHNDENEGWHRGTRPGKFRDEHLDSVRASQWDFAFPNRGVVLRGGAVSRLAGRETGLDTLELE
jgi:hypothetical protein